MVLPTLKKQLFEGKSHHKSPQADSPVCPWLSLPVRTDSDSVSENTTPKIKSQIIAVFNSTSAFQK